VKPIASNLFLTQAYNNRLHTKQFRVSQRYQRKLEEIGGMLAENMLTKNTLRKNKHVGRSQKASRQYTKGRRMQILEHDHDYVMLCDGMARYAINMEYMPYANIL
jgi:hypothetical protein